MPLVLTESLATYGGEYDHWEDVTGKQYHFPNKYHRKIQPGSEFIYYRGTRAPQGKRIAPVYFGRGRIDSVFEDTGATEKKLKQWYCTIVDYEPFPKLVGIRDGANYVEPVFEVRNRRVDAVRSIDEATHQRIIGLSGLLAGPRILPSTVDESTRIIELPTIDQVVATPANNSLWVPHSKVAAKVDALIVDKPLRELSAARRSASASIIGNRAELIVFRYLKESLSKPILSSLRWLANEGITPGFDITYRDENGNDFALEVKGTTGLVFPNVEVTAQEWTAAQLYRDRFILVLVSECGSNSPKLQFVPNPYQMLAANEIEATPILWRLTIRSS